MFRFAQQAWDGRTSDLAQHVPAPLRFVQQGRNTVLRKERAGIVLQRGLSLLELVTKSSFGVKGFAVVHHVARSFVDVWSVCCLP